MKGLQATARSTWLDPAVFKGKVSIVNVWASWCVPCHDEAPLLTELAKDKRLQLVGINYKDAPDNARRFLGRYGNPFGIVGVDGNGRASIEWGVYGVPETFIVGRDGTIVYKLVGPITPENIERVLKVEIEKALKAGASRYFRDAGAPAYAVIGTGAFVGDALRSERLAVSRSLRNDGPE